MLVTEQYIGFDNAVRVLHEGLEAIERGDAVFDLSNVKRANSAAIAVALDWLRKTQDRGLEFKIQNAPESFNKLIELYGLKKILI